MKNKIFKITISENLIKPYYNIFGHFFLDHLFQIYKIKEWYYETYNICIDSILIDKDLLYSISFIEPFYKMIFNNIFTNINNSNYEIIDLGIIIGSKLNSEKDVIYLSKSDIKIDIPDYVIENGRKLSEYNKKMLNKLIIIIKNNLNIDNNFNNEIDNKNILIINRSKPPRELINLNNLIFKLNSIGYKCDIICFENLDLYKQIKLISSYKNIITACGSVQVHICFINKNAKYIELCESGFRYPNTAIYGYLCNKKTYSLCAPLDNNYFLNCIKNQNIETQNLFNIGNSLPSIINNDINSIEREKKFYSKLISLNCFDIHTIQNIDCNKYINKIINIIE